MGITAILERENGEPVEVVGDPTNVLHRFLPTHSDPAYPYLSCIDWYGDTVFNYLQAPQFLREWQRLRDEQEDPGLEARQVIDGVQGLAERLRDERFLYLKFYGD